MAEKSLAKRMGQREHIYILHGCCYLTLQQMALITSTICVVVLFDELFPIQQDDECRTMLMMMRTLSDTQNTEERASQY